MEFKYLSYANHKLIAKKNDGDERTNDGMSEGKLQIDKLCWGVKRNKIAYLFDLLSHFFLSLLTYQHVCM